MTTTFIEESVSYNSVSEAVRESLGLERQIPITDSLLRYEAEGADLLALLFELEIPSNDYFSAGANSWTDEGRRFLADAVCSSLRDGEINRAYSFLKLRDCKGVNEVLQNITTVDLYNLANYHADLRDEPLPNTL